MEAEPYVAVLDKDAIPLHVWESLAAETARYIRDLLRDPVTRAEIMPLKGGENLETRQEADQGPEGAAEG